MNVTNIVVTKTAVETTANGVFTVEYSTTNGVLNRIQADIQRSTGENGQAQFQSVGTIYMEHGYVNCNLTQDSKPSLLLKDFESLVEKINLSIDAEGERVGGETN